MRQGTRLKLAVGLGFVALIGLVFLDFDGDRWMIAEEKVKVGGIQNQDGDLSFFVTISEQPTNSVLRLRPVHYLRPYQLQQRIGTDWVEIPVPRKEFWSALSSATGLNRCLFRFHTETIGGEYRAMLVYRYRGRWDYFRLRLSNRLPDTFGRWIMPRRASGAVWTEPFGVEALADEE